MNDQIRRDRGGRIRKSALAADGPSPTGPEGGEGRLNPRRVLLFTCSLLLISGTAVPGDRPAGGKEPSAVFHTALATPPLHMEPSPGEPGAVQLRIEGFGTLQRPGAPAVPVRIWRVAIPDQTSPILRILRIRTRDLGVLRLSPVPVAGREGEGRRDAEGLAVAPSPRRPSLRPDPELFRPNGDYPESPIALGQVGYLREQRYVELIFTPVQISPATGRCRIAEEVELEIESARAAPQGTRRLPSREGERFEAIYRTAILNYTQGKHFRQASTPESDSAVPPPPSTVEAAGVGTTYKVAVRQDGIYRISCSVSSCSIPDLVGQNPNTFRLRNKGVEVPMRVLGGADNSFDFGDVLEFYGQKQTAPFTALNCGPPTCPSPIYQYNDVTDVNVYLLDATASTARLRMTTVDGTPGVLATEPHFAETAHWEINDRFMPLNSADPFYSDPTMSTNATTPATPRDLSVSLPGLASVAFTASVKVRLRGVSSDSGINPDHRTSITVNGAPSTTNLSDWDGEAIFDQTTTAAQSVLSDPSVVRLEVPVVSGLSLDQVIPDFAEITYRRVFQAVSGRLGFTFPNQAAKFSVGGFAGGPILAYDLSRVLAGTTDTIEPRQILNGTDTGASLTFQVASESAPTGPVRGFVVVGAGGFLSPNSVVPMLPISILDPTNEADYLIIAHASLVDLTAGSPYKNFISYLEQSRLLKTRLVTIEEIYDAFNNSIAHPEAIRSFLAYAHDQWRGPSGTSSPPTYLLLLGDAVWDLKNNLNRSDWIDLVPTPIMFYSQAIISYYAADTWLASFLGNDQTPDILFGRIPARTLAQANTVFSKILGYAQSPPPGAWRSDGYFLADVGNDPQETTKFELEGDNAAAFFQSPWTFTKQYYAQPPYNAPTGGCNCTPTQFKNDFVNHWNSSHPAITSFYGHGAFDILGNDLFFRSGGTPSPDTPLLTNGPYLPFFFNSDCLTGGFHAVGTDSIGEALVESPVGGSIAFFGPASLSFTFIGSTVNGQLYGDLFSPQKLRELGILTANARSVLYQQGSIVDFQGYTLLGDPSLELVLPAPQPPTGFAVAAGNARVDLSWTSSNDANAVGTNLYRTQSVLQPYTKINATPVSGTTYADLSVTNGTTYFYRAVSVDSGGFEGAVTNTNADCGATPAADGPECRRATPKNLVPPAAPQGVSVRDTGTGTTLDIAWAANPESDIARYRVHSGPSPGVYPRIDDAGPATAYTLQGLAAGVAYYIAISAVNTSGIEGGLSGPLAGIPHAFVGIAPPRTIHDLMVTRSGDDLVLSWGAVTTNILGNPTTVDHYNVYRGTTPSFVPANSTNRIGIVTATANPSFLHAGGATAPDDGYYLVSAIDLDGFASGLGGDLPSGTLSLTVAPSPTAGMLRIAWPPVTTTVGGQIAAIDHYTLYGSTAVLPRRLIGASNLLLDNLTGPFIDVSDPAASLYYYNLVAVDRRGNLSPY